ncbi:MAG: biotin--[acetyl-CoA-carboxylase] ligase [Acidithiobacillus sp.]
MAIPALDAPSAALQNLLHTLSGGGSGSSEPESVDATSLLHEAASWGIPLQNGVDGLRLEYPHAALSGSEIAAASGLEARQIRILAACASTNTELLANTDSPTACLAESQWAGRGRRGRHWASTFGHHLTLSYAWTQSTPVNPALTLVAALSVFTLLQDSVPGLWLKWPNDLWIGQQKLGGLLVEARTLAQAQTRLVVGLGLNIHADPSLPETATSLAEQGLVLPRSFLAGRILRQWQTDFAVFAESGLSAFIARWQQAAAPLLGKSVHIMDALGDHEAQVIQLGEDGRLQVQSGGCQPHWISAGDVSLRPLAS